MKKAKKSSGSAGLEYQGYSAEDARKDKEEQEAARQSTFGKITSGKNVLRIVPAKPGKKWKRVTYRHFVDVPGVGTISFTCPKWETKGKRKCKTCEQHKKLLGTGDPIDEKKAKRIEAQRKVLFNAVNRKDEDAGPRVYEIGRGIENDLTNMREVEDVDFIDPIKGCDIIIVKTGQGRQGTRYKTKEGDECPLHESKAVMRDWIENQHDLDACVKLESDEDIEARMRGEKPGDDDDRRSSKRRSRDDDDDDEDDLDLDEDDDEDEDEDDEIDLDDD